MICPNCGETAPEEAAFCPNCGTKLVLSVPSDTTMPIETPIPDPVPLFTEEAELPEAVEPIAAPPVSEPVIQPELEIAETPVSAAVPVSSASKVKKAFSVILSVLFFLTALIASTLTVARASLSAENVESVVNSFDLGEIPVKLDGETVSLAEYMLHCIGSDPDIDMDRFSFSEKERKIKKLLGKPFAKNMIANSVEMYRAYFVDSDDFDGLDACAVTDMIQKREGQIIRAMSEFTEDDIIDSLYYDEIESYIDDAIGDSLTIDALKSRYGLPIPLIRFALSDTALLAFWIASGVMLIALLLLNIPKLGKIFLYIGIPAAAVSAIFLAVTIILGLSPSFIPASIGPKIADIFSGYILFPGIAAGCSAVFVIVGCILNARKR